MEDVTVQPIGHMTDDQLNDTVTIPIVAYDVDNDEVIIPVVFRKRMSGGTVMYVMRLNRTAPQRGGFASDAAFEAALRDHNGKAGSAVLNAVDSAVVSVDEWERILTDPGLTVATDIVAQIFRSLLSPVAARPTTPPRTSSRGGSPTTRTSGGGASAKGSTSTRSRSRTR